MTDKDKPRGGGKKPFDRKTSAGPRRDSDGKGDFAKKTTYGKRDDTKRDDTRRPARRDDAPSRDRGPSRDAGRDTGRSPAGASGLGSSDLAVERISKIMARAGVASRRDCERLIMEGRVRLNGKVLDTPAVTCTLDDTIELDGVPIRGIERTRLWLYHKPSGLVTTNSDPEGRPTVFENLPPELPRVMSIGRLDINTEGLLLLTNDGGLARVLELPATGWLRRYRVRAYGEIEQKDLDALKDGIAVEGVLYAGIEATLDRVQGHNCWITMGLREGKNREIKNVLGALGLEVNRLIRVSYGPFQLGDIDEGHVMEVRSKMLRDQLGPRLIEEAKANFEAPILDAPKPQPTDVDDEDQDDHSSRSYRDKPSDRREEALSRFENKRPDSRDRDGERPAPRRDGDRPAPRRDGERPAPRRDGDRPAPRRDGERFAARGDRDDRPPRRDRDSAPGDRRSRPDDRGSDRFGDRDKDDRPKRPPLGTIRTTNVWRAPDSRVGEEKSTRKDREVMSGSRKVSVAYKEKDPDAPAPKPKRTRKPVSARPPRPDARSDARGDSRGESRGEYRGEKRNDSRGDSRSEFRGDRDRGPSSDRSRPRTPREGDERRFDERPRRSEGDRAPERSGDRPARGFGKPAGERPARSFDKPAGERPARGFGERSGKPFGKPGGKPGGRPSGTRNGDNSGGRPSSGRPSDRPSGGPKGAGRGADRRR